MNKCSSCVVLGLVLLFSFSPMRSEEVGGGKVRESLAGRFIEKTKKFAQVTIERSRTFLKKIKGKPLGEDGEGSFNSVDDPFSDNSDYIKVVGDSPSSGSSGVTPDGESLKDDIFERGLLTPTPTLFEGEDSITFSGHDKEVEVDAKATGRQL